MRTRRLVSKVVAAAFLLLAMQQLVAAPAMRESVRIEQRIARISTTLKWREVIPSAAIAAQPEMSAVTLRLHPRAPQPFTTEVLERLRFQRPPPSL